MRRYPVRSKSLGALSTGILLAVLMSHPISQSVQDSGRGLDAAYAQISRLFDEAEAKHGREIHQSLPEVKEVLERLIDFETITHQVLGKYRDRLSRADRILLMRALEDSMVRRCQQLYYRIKKSGSVSLHLDSRQTSKNKRRMACTLTGQEDKIVILLHLTDREGRRTISDVESDGRRLTKYYGNYVHDILKKYSFPVLIAELNEAGSIMIDDFSDTKTGGFPDNWHWKKDKNDKILLTVQEEDGNRYINAKDRGDSVTYGREFRWNVKRFPYISWRWRIHALPPGGDERFNETNDSAAALYIIYDKNLVGVPKVVKYVWSTTLAEGTATRRTGIGRPWTIVAKSGDQGMGVWHTEVFNALEAFRETFGGDPPDATLGIAVLTDANATDAYAEADYDEFKLLRTAEAESGVKRFLKGGK